MKDRGEAPMQPSRNGREFITGREKARVGAVPVLHAA